MRINIITYIFFLLFTFVFSFDAYATVCFLIGDDSCKSDTPLTFETEGEQKCKDQGFLKYSEGDRNGREKPGSVYPATCDRRFDDVCDYDEEYCCDTNYRHNPARPCPDDKIQDEEAGLCRNRMKCVCDSAYKYYSTESYIDYYGITHTRPAASKCPNNSVPDETPFTFCEETIHYGPATLTIRKSMRCVCPDEYNKTCTNGQVPVNEEDFCKVDGGNTLYKECKCPDGYTTGCTNGAANGTGTCTKDGTIYYEQCKSDGERCAELGYSNAACPKYFEPDPSNVCSLDSSYKKCRFSGALYCADANNACAARNNCATKFAATVSTADGDGIIHRVNDNGPYTGDYSDSDYVYCDTCYDQIKKLGSGPRFRFYDWRENITDVGGVLGRGSPGHGFVRKKELAVTFNQYPKIALLLGDVTIGANSDINDITFNLTELTGNYEYWLGYTPSACRRPIITIPYNHTEYLPAAYHGVDKVLEKRLVMMDIVIDWKSDFMAMAELDLNGGTAEWYGINISGKNCYGVTPTFSFNNFEPCRLNAFPLPSGQCILRIKNGVVEIENTFRTYGGNGNLVTVENYKNLSAAQTTASCNISNNNIPNGADDDGLKIAMTPSKASTWRIELGEPSLTLAEAKAAAVELPYEPSFVKTGLNFTSGSESELDTPVITSHQEIIPLDAIPMANSNNARFIKVDGGTVNFNGGILLNGAKSYFVAKNKAIVNIGNFSVRSSVYSGQVCTSYGNDNYGKLACDPNVYAMIDPNYSQYVTLLNSFVSVGRFASIGPISALNGMNSLAKVYVENSIFEVKNANFTTSKNTYFCYGPSGTMRDSSNTKTQTSGHAKYFAQDNHNASIQRRTFGNLFLAPNIDYCATSELPPGI